jgi:hypothetical protein
MDDLDWSSQGARRVEPDIGSEKSLGIASQQLEVGLLENLFNVVGGTALIRERVV